MMPWPWHHGHAPGNEFVYLSHVIRKVGRAVPGPVYIKGQTSSSSSCNRPADPAKPVPAAVNQPAKSVISKAARFANQGLLQPQTNSQPLPLSGDRSTTLSCNRPTDLHKQSQYPHYGYNRAPAAVDP